MCMARNPPPVVCEVCAGNRGWQEGDMGCDGPVTAYWMRCVYCGGTGLPDHMLWPDFYAECLPEAMAFAARRLRGRE